MAVGEAISLVLTPLEERLARSVRAGEPLDLIGDGPTDQKAMTQWDQSRTIRAVVIRALLRGQIVEDPDPRGVRLRGARIEGLLELQYLTSRSPLELSACYLPDGVDGDFASLPALGLSGSRMEGGVRLLGAHVGGEFDASGATLTNDSGPALSADGLHVDQDMYLSHGFTATGTGGNGAVRLLGARVGGLLVVSSATLTNDSGPALAADRIQVGQNLVLIDGFMATGAGDYGVVRLLGAHIGGLLYASGATLTNDSGPALSADGLHVDQDLLLNNGFTATGTGEDGAVRLLGVRVDGNLDASGATLTNDSGPALVAVGMQVGQTLFLNDGFTATGTGDDGVVRLLDAKVGGSLRFDPAAVKDLDGRPGKLQLDGLVYAGLPGEITVKEWQHVLGEQTTDYAAQPYRQLAAGALAAGHDGDVRRILMRQRQDQLDRLAVTARPERAWAKLTGATLGYGYQPWRALLILLGVVAVAVTLTVVLGSHGGLAHPAPATSINATISPCSTIERIAVGLDFSLPLIKTGARDACTPTATTAGETLTIIGWILQLIAWGLATLFIAGFTSIVRKT